MRVPSDIETIKGKYKAETEGTLYFLFDNSFSWFNSKLLTYSISLYQVYTAHHIQIVTSLYLPLFFCVVDTARFYASRSESCSPKPSNASGNNGRLPQGPEAANERERAIPRVGFRN